jgi:hypothetical protein
MTTFAELKKESVQSFGDFGAWAFDEWKSLNETYFNGKNIAGGIVWGSTPKGDSMGYYYAAENLIYLHRHLMRPIYPTGNINWGIRHINKKIASDVLLHEMIHQSIHQTGGWEGEASHNNERYVQEINRIAKLLGLDVKARVIKKKMIHGKVTWHEEPGCLTLKELYEFPYYSRPNNYYYK